MFDYKNQWVGLQQESVQHCAHYLTFTDADFFREVV